MNPARPTGGPGVIAVPGAVQEVENGVAARSLVIAWRRINMHAAEPVEGFGKIRHRFDRPVRHIARIHEVRAWNIEEAPDGVVGLAGGGGLGSCRIARGDHRKAVHIEIITVLSRLNRPDRAFPNVVRVLGQNHTASRAGNVTGADADSLGVRSQYAERDVAVGGDFHRRGPRWSATTPATLGSSRIRGWRRSLGEAIGWERECCHSGGGKNSSGG